MDSVLKSQLEQLVKGYTRTVAQLKQSGDMKIHEGKDYLSFTAYRMLAKKLASMKDERASATSSSFAWAFFVVQWNLMARSESVTAILLDHISWTDDSLIIYIPKHKADQEGTYILSYAFINSMYIPCTTVHTSTAHHACNLPFNLIRCCTAIDQCRAAYIFLL
jgi:hypothetical protein